MPTDEFAARIAAPLKQYVEARPDLEDRVMRAVAQASRPWWHADRRVAFSPRWLAAAAAGVVILLSGAVGLTRSFVVASPETVAVADTVYVVRFVLAVPDARSVALAGDFNGWSRSATPLVEGENPGQWSVTLSVPSGRHEYAFIVDGERWVPDPTAVAVRDEFGNESSVLRVGGGHRGT
jgi:hypothetical protein